LAESAHPGTRAAAGCLVAFLGAASFWWVYFDRSAEAATEVVVRSADPGRLGRRVAGTDRLHFPHVVPDPTGEGRLDR